MEKINQNKFKDKQLNSSSLGTIGGNGEPSFWDNLIEAVNTSEIIHPYGHATGSQGCGHEHEEGCHHHYVDNADGTTQTYIGCGSSAHRCGVGNH